MLEEIKKELLSDPENIKAVLEHFGYANIVIHNSYISFGRDEHSSKKSIVIRLENNSFIFICDYAKNINKDLFSYIMSQRGVDFKTVLNVVKNVLGISDYYDLFQKKSIFGGFYDQIRTNYTSTPKIYDECVLDQYENIPNLRFLKDHISIKAQQYFQIGYDVESNGITIPVRDQIGGLIGVKERFNYDVPDGEMKYFYSIPCSMSKTLYGYSQNYQYLTQGTVLIAEAEKSVLQAYSYGIRNIVALGSGTVSLTQTKMLLELNPKEIILLHDESYDLVNILHNAETIKNYSRFSEIKVGYWDFYGKGYPYKCSPTDLGKEKFEYILENEIKWIGVED